MKSAKYLWEKVALPVGAFVLAGGGMLTARKISTDIKDPQWGEGIEDAAIAAGSFVIVASLAVLGALYARKKLK